MIKARHVDGRYGTIYLFEMVPSGGVVDGWSLDVHALREGRHDLDFRRVQFVKGHPVLGLSAPLFYVDTAWITADGVAHLPDEEMRSMAFEDRIALDELLRSLPEHPPFNTRLR